VYASRKERELPRERPQAKGLSAVKRERRHTKPAGQTKKSGPFETRADSMGAKGGVGDTTPPV